MTTSDILHHVTQHWNNMSVNSVNVQCDNNNKKQQPNTNN